MNDTRSIWAYFDDDLAVVRAIESLRPRDVEFTLYAPYMTHALEHALEHRPSPVRLFVLAGGLAGCATGFFLTIWTATRWHLIVGGKPIVAIPPYLVIAFELTLLFGALAGVLGLLLLGRLPRRKRAAGYDPSLSAGRFALCVSPVADDSGLEESLRQAGATDLKVLAGPAGGTSHA